MTLWWSVGFWMIIMAVDACTCYPGSISLVLSIHNYFTAEIWSTNSGGRYWCAPSARRSARRGATVAGIVRISQKGRVMWGHKPRPRSLTPIYYWRGTVGGILRAVAHGIAPSKLGHVIGELALIWATLTGCACSWHGINTVASCSSRGAMRWHWVHSNLPVGPSRSSLCSIFTYQTSRQASLAWRMVATTLRKMISDHLNRFANGRILELPSLF